MPKKTMTEKQYAMHAMLEKFTDMPQNTDDAINHKTVLAKIILSYQEGGKYPGLNFSEVRAFVSSHELSGWTDVKTIMQNFVLPLFNSAYGSGDTDLCDLLSLYILDNISSVDSRAGRTLYTALEEMFGGDLTNSFISYLSGLQQRDTGEAGEGVAPSAGDGLYTEEGAGAGVEPDLVVDTAGAVAADNGSFPAMTAHPVGGFPAVVGGVNLPTGIESAFE